MGRKPIWRVWYGKRLGIPQSFEDIGNLYGAANFASLMMADRIEVIRRPLTLTVTMERRAMATEQRPPSP